MILEIFTLEFRGLSVQRVKRIWFFFSNNVELPLVLNSLEMKRFLK